MAWRKNKPTLINTNHIKAWLDFEVVKRTEAMKKDLSDDCPYGKPDDVHKILISQEQAQDQDLMWNPMSRSI